MSDATGASAGWYADPYGQASLRWWDGAKWTGHVHEPVEAARAAPLGRLIRTAADAEVVAAEWMVHWGFSDASRTQASRDGGIDVDSRAAVAQVKATHAPVGRPMLQALHGAATAVGKQSLFFALESFTPDARSWAESVGMALFRFDLQGVPEPVDDAARRIVQRKPTPEGSRSSVSTSVAARSERILVRVSTPQRLKQAVTSKSSRRENVVRSYDVWLPLELVRLDYSTQHRFGRCRAHADLLIYESLSGARWTPPKQRWNPVSGTCDAQVLAPRVRATEIVKENNQLWQKLSQLKQQAAIDRARSELVARGVPPEAIAGSFHESGQVLLPVHFAIMDGPKGMRIIAVDAHVGEANDRLSRAATEQAGWLRTRLV